MATGPTEAEGLLRALEELIDPVAAKLASYKWPYADQDPSAMDEIARRVARTGKRRDTIPYSKLVEGLAFHLATVNGGEPFQIGPDEWTELHRALVGDFLGCLCAATYLRGGFMGSALVVSRETGEPSEGFRKFMRELGVLRTRGDDEFLSFWSDQVTKAYAWYAENEW